MPSLNGFDANVVEPTTPFGPIPAGRYVAAITDSQWKDTKSGKGRYVELTFSILEGEYRGRLVWVRLNLENPNQQAVVIARAELSAICRAIGVMKPNDAAELHDLPMQISVRLKKRPDSEEFTNEVRGFTKNVAGNDGRQTNDSAPPWKRV